MNPTLQNSMQTNHQSFRLLGGASSGVSLYRPGPRSKQQHLQMTGRGTGNLYIDVSNKVCPTTIQQQQEKQSQAWLNAQSWHTNTKCFKKHTHVSPPKQTTKSKKEHFVACTDSSLCKGVPMGQSPRGSISSKRHDHNYLWHQSSIFGCWGWAYNTNYKKEHTQSTMRTVSTWL